MSHIVRAAPAAFSRPLEVAKVGDEALRVSIAAEPTERAALARLNGLPGIDRLEADFTVIREGRSGLRVTGTVKAAVQQTCVISLEPFDTEVDEAIEVHFLPQTEVDALDAARPKGDDADDEAPELPDPIIGGRIDLGSVAAEFFSLGLDPYPRKPGVAYEPRTAEETAPVSPFAALGRLKSERPV